MSAIRLGIVVRAPLRRHPGSPPGPSGLDEIVERARAAERAGFDAFFLDGRQPAIDGGRGFAGTATLSPERSLPVVDPFVVLGAVAVSTSKLTIGCLSSAVGERPPAVLAKVATSLDVCSDGRTVLALAPDRADPGEDGLERLSEALEVCRALIRVPSPSFSGRHYRLDSASNEPRYEHVTGGMPIVLGIPSGCGEATTTRLLDLAARFADLCVIELAPLEAGAIEALRATMSPFARRAGRLDGCPTLLARVAAGTLDEGALGKLARTCRAAGADGLVLDWSDGAVSPARLFEVGELLAGS